MDNTPVIIPVSKLKTHLISAALTFISVFLPTFATLFTAGLPDGTATQWGVFFALAATAVRAAAKLAIQSTLLQEITFWKKQVDAAKVEGQTTTQLPS